MNHTTTNTTKKVELSPEEQIILDGLQDPDAPAAVKTLRWDDTTQRKILGSVIADPSMIAEAGWFQPEYFTNKVHAQIARLVVDYYKQYRAAPDESYIAGQLAPLYDEPGMRLFARGQLREVMEHFIPGLASRAAHIGLLTTFGKRQAAATAFKRIAQYAENPTGEIDDVIRQCRADLSKALTVAGAQKRDWHDVDSLLGLPDPIWLVRKHLPADSTAVIYGPSGSGKTFLALHVALCVATSLPIWGDYRVKPGKVVYIAAEGSSGIKDRVRAWINHHGIKPESGSFQLLFRPVNFATDETAVEKLLDEMAERFSGQQPDLIVVDTLAKNFGGDENSTADMAKYVGAMEALRIATGGCVLSIHHTGKDEDRGARGSNSLRAGVDVEILVSETNGGSRIETKKQKNDEKIGAYLVAHKPVYVRQDDDGHPWSTLVLEYVGTERDAKRAELHALGDDEAERYLAAVPVLDGAAVTLENGATLEAIYTKTGLTKRTEPTVRKRLITAGRLQVKEFEKRGHTTYRFYRETVLQND